MLRTVSSLYKAFQGNIAAIPGRWLALIFFLVLAFIPVLSQQPYALRIVTFASIYAIFAVSWDFLGGYVGQMNLGQAAFFGTGAYVAALLNLNAALPPVVTIPLGGLAAVVMGLIACVPALRLRGFYLAFVTLALPLILKGIVLALPNVTGGESGLSGLTSLGGYVTAYYIVFFVMLFSVLILWKLTDIRSKVVRVGVIFQAIREDEIAARVSGINTVSYKMLAFSISAFFAGIAGGLYAHVTRVTGPSTLELLLSFNAIVWTVFGGIGSIYGAVAGVFILSPFVELMQAIWQWRMLLYGVLIVVVLLYMPEGVAVWIRGKIQRRCPRCGLVNAATRSNCRACFAPLRPARR
ncbi:MAG: branched-chain amino acid ABC transporter permease [Chloroflexi bacterium]|nr:branched-chain amino acid ABC transporter permease [Chloroflexota bacterium]